MVSGGHGCEVFDALGHRRTLRALHLLLGARDRDLIDDGPQVGVRLHLLELQCPLRVGLRCPLPRCLGEVLACDAVLLQRLVLLVHQEALLKWTPVAVRAELAVLEVV